MPTHRYPLPNFLQGQVSREAYVRWLDRKAAAHVRRDRKRLAHPISISDYKRSIHAAVEASGGHDFYTGQVLSWDMISTYDNDLSRGGRSNYKATFALLPTVDHVENGAGGYGFVICGWRTNDAKADLELPDFLDLCRRVLARHG